MSDDNKFKIMISSVIGVVVIVGLLIMAGCQHDYRLYNQQCIEVLHDALACNHVVH